MSPWQDYAFVIRHHEPFAKTDNKEKNSISLITSCHFYRFGFLNTFVIEIKFSLIFFEWFFFHILNQKIYFFIKKAFYIFFTLFPWHRRPQHTKMFCLISNYVHKSLNIYLIIYSLCLLFTIYVYLMYSH